MTSRIILSLFEQTFCLTISVKLVFICSLSIILSIIILSYEFLLSRNQTFVLFEFYLRNCQSKYQNRTVLKYWDDPSDVFWNNYRSNHRRVGLGPDSNSGLITYICFHLFFERGCRTVPHQCPHEFAEHKMDTAMPNTNQLRFTDFSLVPWNCPVLP